LVADPRETINHFADPQMKPLIDQLSAHIADFFSKYSIPEHSGLHLEEQASSTPSSPWLRPPPGAK
jgi:hypothetical protein